MGDWALLEDAIDKFILATDSKLDSWSMKHGSKDTVEVLLKDYHDFYTVKNFPGQLKALRAKVNDAIERSERSLAGRNGDSGIERVNDKMKQLENIHVELQSTSEMLNEIKDTWSKFDKSVEELKSYMNKSYDIINSNSSSAFEFFQDFHHWCGVHIIVNESSNFLISGANDPTKQKLKEQILIVNSRWKYIADYVKLHFGDKMKAQQMQKFEEDMSKCYKWIEDAKKCLNGSKPKCNLSDVITKQEALKELEIESSETEEQFKSLSRLGQTLVPQISDEQKTKLLSRLRRLKDDIVLVKRQLEEMMPKGHDSAELVQRLDEKRYQLETCISSCRKVFEEFGKGITLAQLNEFLNKFKDLSTSNLDEQLSELETILSQLKSSETVDMSDFASTLNELQQEIKKQQSGISVILPELEARTKDSNRLNGIKDGLDASINNARSVLTQPTPKEKRLKAARHESLRSAQQKLEDAANKMAEYRKLSENLASYSALNAKTKKQVIDQARKLQRSSTEILGELKAAVAREDVADQERLFLQLISGGEAQLQSEISKIRSGSPIQNILSTHITFFEEQGHVINGSKALEALSKSNMAQEQTESYQAHRSRWMDFMKREKNFRQELESNPHKWETYIQSYNVVKSSVDECMKFYSYFTSDEAVNITPEEFELSLSQLEKHEQSVIDLRCGIHKQSEVLRNLSSWCSNQHYSTEESRLAQLNQSFASLESSLPSMKERANGLKDIFDCLMELESASDEIEHILKPFDQMPKLENIPQAENELQKIDVISKKLSNKELPTLIAEAENLLTQTQPVPKRLISTHNHAQTVLKKSKEKLQQRQMVLKKLVKDWQTYEDKKTVVENTIEASKKVKFGPEENVSTEETLKANDKLLKDLLGLRSKFSILQTAGSYVAYETTVDTKTECQTIKRALDVEIKKLQGEIDETKVAVSAQKSLERTIQANDKILTEIQNSDVMSGDATDGGGVSLDGVISDLEKKLADIESKEDQLDDSLAQTEKMRASPSVLKQARKQREEMEQVKDKLKKTLQTAKGNQKQVEEFKSDLETIEQFMTKVDARSLSIPAKLANLSEVSQLKSEFQAFEEERQSLERVIHKLDSIGQENPHLEKLRDNLQEVESKFDRISKCISGDLKTYCDLNTAFDNFDSKRKSLVSKLELCEKRLKEIANSRTLDDGKLESWNQTLTELNSEFAYCKSMASELVNSASSFEASTTDKKPTSAIEFCESRVKQFEKSLKMKCDSVTKCRDTKRSLRSMTEKIDECVDMGKTNLQGTATIEINELESTDISLSKVIQMLEESKVGSILKDAKSVVKIFPNSEASVQTATQYFVDSSDQLENLKNRAKERSNLISKWSALVDLQSRIRDLSKTGSSSDVVADRTKIAPLWREIDYWKQTVDSMDQQAQKEETSFTCDGEAISFKGFLEELEKCLKEEEASLHQREKKRDEQKKLWKEFCGRKEEILKWVKKTDVVIEDLDEAKQTVEQLGTATATIKESLNDRVMTENLKAIESLAKQMKENGVPIPHAGDGANPALDDYKTLASLVESQQSELTSQLNDITVYHDNLKTYESLKKGISEFVNRGSDYLYGTSNLPAVQEDLEKALKKSQALLSEGSEMRHVISQLDSIKNKMSKKGSKWMDESFMDNHAALIQSFNNLGTNLKMKAKFLCDGSETVVKQAELKEDICADIQKVESLIEVTPEKLADPLLLFSSLEQAKKELSHSETLLAEMKQQVSAVKDDPSQTIDDSLLTNRIAELEKQIKSSREKINKSKITINTFKSEKSSLLDEISTISAWLQNSKTTIQQGEDEIDGLVVDNTEKLTESIDYLTDLQHSCQTKLKSLLEIKSKLSKKSAFYGSPAMNNLSEELAKVIAASESFSAEVERQRKQNVDTLLENFEKTVEAVEMELAESSTKYQTLKNTSRSLKDLLQKAADIKALNSKLERTKDNLHEGSKLQFMMNAKLLASEPENEMLVSNVVARLEHCHSKSRALKSDLDQFEIQTQNAIELVSKFERQAEQLEGDLKKYFDDPARMIKEFDSFEMIDKYEAKLEEMESQLGGHAKRLEIVGHVSSEVKSNSLMDVHLFNQRKNNMNNDVDRMTSEVQGQKQVVKTLKENVEEFQQLEDLTCNQLEEVRKLLDLLNGPLNSSAKTELSKQTFSRAKQHLDDCVGTLQKLEDSASKLLTSMSPKGQPMIKGSIKQLKDEISAVEIRLTAEDEKIKEATAAWNAWDKTHSSFLSWLSGAELRVSTNAQIKLEVSEKQQELDSLRLLMKEIRSHSSDMEELHELAEQLISVCGHSSANELADLSTRFELVSKSAKENVSKQELLLNQHGQFLSIVQDGEKWLLNMSRKLNSLTKKSVDSLDQDEDDAGSTNEIKQQLEKVQGLYASISDYEIELSEVSSTGNHLMDVHKTFPEFELSTNKKINDLKDSHVKLLEKAKSQLLALRTDLEKINSLEENLTAIEEWTLSTEGELGQMFDTQLCSSDEWAMCESSIRDMLSKLQKRRKDVANLSNSSSSKKTGQVSAKLDALQNELTASIHHARSQYNEWMQYEGLKEIIDREMFGVKDKLLEISNTTLPLNVKSAQLSLNNVKTAQSSIMDIQQQVNQLPEKFCTLVKAGCDVSTISSPQNSNNLVGFVVTVTVADGDFDSMKEDCEFLKNDAHKLQKTTEQRINEIHAVHQSHEQMNDMIEQLMKQASVLESDTSIPLSLKSEKAKILERDITEKSEKNKETFRQICDKVYPFLRNEDKPTVENMARSLENYWGSLLTLTEMLRQSLEETEVQYATSLDMLKEIDQWLDANENQSGAGVGNVESSMSKSSESIEAALQTQIVFLGELDQRKEVVEQLAEQTKPNQPLCQLSDTEKETFGDLTDPLLERIQTTRSKTLEQKSHLEKSAQDLDELLKCLKKTFDWLESSEKSAFDLSSKLANQQSVNDLKEHMSHIDAYNPFIKYCNQKAADLFPGCSPEEQTQLKSSLTDINNRYRDLKTGVQKDIEGKQSAIITEKAVKEEAKRMLKWLEATKGKLKQSPLDNKSGKIEIDLKNAEDLEEEMKTKEAELTEMLAKMEGMSDQIGEEPCQQIAEMLSQLKQEAALVKQSNQEQKQQLAEALEAKNLFLDEFDEIESELNSIQSDMKELANQNFSWDPESIESRTAKSEALEKRSEELKERLDNLIASSNQIPESQKAIIEAKAKELAGKQLEVKEICNFEAGKSMKVYEDVKTVDGSMKTLEDTVEKSEHDMPTVKHDAGTRLQILEEMLEKLEEEELQLANSLTSASDSYKKLSDSEKKALDRKLDALKKSLQGVKNTIGKEQEKAKTVVEKRNLIEEACEVTKGWQTDFKESLKTETVPLDPELVKEMIRDLKEKTKELVMFESSQKQKVDQLKRFLDQWKEPHESDTVLVQDTFEHFGDCKELVNNQLVMYEKMLEQREDLCGTLDNLEKWTKAADIFLQGVDLKEFCVLDSKLAEIKRLQSELSSQNKLLDSANDEAEKVVESLPIDDQEDLESRFESIELDKIDSKISRTLDKLLANQRAFNEFSGGIENSQKHFNELGAFTFAFPCSLDEATVNQELLKDKLADCAYFNQDVEKLRNEANLMLKSSNQPSSETISRMIGGLIDQSEEIKHNLENLKQKAELASHLWNEYEDSTSEFKEESERVSEEIEGLENHLPTLDTLEKAKELKALLEESQCLRKLTKASSQLDSQTANADLKHQLKSDLEKSKAERDELKARIERLIAETEDSLACEEEMIVQTEQSKHTLMAINDQLLSLPIDDDLDYAEKSVDELQKAMDLVNEAVEAQRVKLQKSGGKKSQNPQVQKMYEELLEQQSELKSLLDEKVSSVNRDKSQAHEFKANINQLLAKIEAKKNEVGRLEALLESDLAPENLAQVNKMLKNAQNDMQNLLAEAEDMKSTSLVGNKIRDPLVAEISEQVAQLNDAEKQCQSKLDNVTKLVEDFNGKVDDVKGLMEENKTVLPSQPITALDSEALKELAEQLKSVNEKLEGERSTMDDCEATKKALASVLGQNCNALGELESESNSLNEEFQSQCDQFNEAAKEVLEEISYRDVATNGLEDIIANIEETRRKMDELEKADFSNPEDLEKANRSINALKKELQHDLELANKIGEKARERYNAKQVPLPTDIAKQLSSIKGLHANASKANKNLEGKLRNAQQSQRKLLDDLGEISNKIDRMEDACLATSEKVSNLEDLNAVSDLKAETENLKSDLAALKAQLSRIAASGDTSKSNKDRINYLMGVVQKLESSLEGTSGEASDLVNSWDEMKQKSAAIKEQMKELQRKIPLAPVQIYTPEELPNRIQKTEGLLQDLQKCKQEMDEVCSKSDNLKECLGISSAVDQIDEMSEDLKNHHEIAEDILHSHFNNLEKESERRHNLIGLMDQIISQLNFQNNKYKEPIKLGVLPDDVSTVISANQETEKKLSSKLVAMKQKIKEEEQFYDSLNTSLPSDVSKKVMEMKNSELSFQNVSAAHQKQLAQCFKQREEYSEKRNDVIAEVEETREEILNTMSQLLKAKNVESVVELGTDIELLKDRMKEVSSKNSALEEAMEDLMTTCGDSTVGEVKRVAENTSNLLNGLEKELKELSDNFDWASTFASNFLELSGDVKVALSNVHSKLNVKAAVLCDDSEIIDQSNRVSSLMSEIDSANTIFKEMESLVRKSKSDLTGKIPECDMGKNLTEVKENIEGVSGTLEESLRQFSVEAERRKCLNESLDSAHDLLTACDYNLKEISANSLSAANTLEKIQTLKSDCECAMQGVNKEMQQTQSEYYQQSAMLPLPIAHKWEQLQSLFEKLNAELKDKEFLALESKNLESYCLEAIQNVSKGLQNCQHEVAADEESQLQICDLNSAVELCDKNKNLLKRVAGLRNTLKNVEETMSAKAQDMKLPAGANTKSLHANAEKLTEKLQEKQAKLNASVDNWQRAKNLSATLEKVAEALDVKDFADVRSLDHIQLQEERLSVESMKGTIEHEDDCKKELLSVIASLAANHGAPAKKGIEEFKSSSDNLDKCYKSLTVRLEEICNEIESRESFVKRCSDIEMTLNVAKMSTPDASRLEHIRDLESANEAAKELGSKTEELSRVFQALHRSEKEKYEEKKIKFPVRLQNSADSLSKELSEEDERIKKLGKRLMEASEIGGKYTEMHEKLKHVTTDVESLVSLSTKSPSSIKTQDSLQNVLSELTKNSEALKKNQDAVKQEKFKEKFEKLDFGLLAKSCHVTSSAALTSSEAVLKACEESAKHFKSCLASWKSLSHAMHDLEDHLDEMKDKSSIENPLTLPDKFLISKLTELKGSLPDLDVYHCDLANIKQSGLKLCTMLGENGFSHQIRKELQTLESQLINCQEMTSQSMTSLKEVLDERESFRSQLVAMQSQIEATSDQFGPNFLFNFDVPNVLTKMEEYKSSSSEIESQYNNLEAEFQNRQHVAQEPNSKNDQDTEEIFSELKKEFLEFQSKIMARVEAAENFLGNLKMFLEKEEKISQEIQVYTKSTNPEATDGEETLEAIDKQLCTFEKMLVEQQHIQTSIEDLNKHASINLFPSLNENGRNLANERLLKLNYEAQAVKTDVNARIANLRSAQQTWKNYLSWLKLGNENLEKFKIKLDENAVNIYSLDSLDGTRKNLEKLDQELTVLEKSAVNDSSASDLIEKLSQNEIQASVRRQVDRIKNQFSKYRKTLEDQLSELKTEENNRTKLLAELNRFSDWLIENEPTVNEDVFGGNVQNKIKELKALLKELRSRDVQMGKLVTNCCDVCKRHNCAVPNALQYKFTALASEKKKLEKSIEDKLRDLDQSVNNLEKVQLDIDSLMERIQSLTRTLDHIHEQRFEQSSLEDLESKINKLEEMASVYGSCHSEANSLEATVQSQKYLMTSFAQELQSISNLLETNSNSISAMKEYFEESKEAWQSIDQSEASIMIALNTAEKLSSSSNRAELYADCSSLLEGIETLKGADKMCKQAMQENVKLNKSVNLLKDNLKISSPELNKKVSKLNQVIEETTAKVRSTVNAYQKELENRQSFLKNLKTLENQTGLTEGLLQDAISQKNSEATSAELESHISQIKNVLTQVDDLDSKKLSVAHQEQSWYKKKNLPKESAEKLSELEEMIENLKERAAGALEGMKVSQEDKSEFENCLKQAKNVVKETQKVVNKLKESGKLQNSSEDSKSLQGKLEEVNRRLGEETKPLVEKMEEFLEKNPEETVLKQKVEEIVAGIQQTKSQITKSQSVAEQDKNLWEDYETSKAAASSLAKLRKELQTVTQMDVSTEHNLESAIQQLKELVEQLSHIDEIAPELSQKLACIISQLGENSSTLSEKANKDDLVAEINSDKSAAEHILENLKEDKVLRENVLSSANNLLKFMADDCQVELDDVTNWSEQLSLLKNLEETMCTLTNIFNKAKENLANKVKENGGMPLPTQLSGKITEVVAKQPFVLKDLVALTEQCASMLRVEQGLVNENIPQCSDWLDNAEEIVGKASDRDKAALEPNVEKEKCRIGSMKFSIRTLSDGGSSPSLIGQLSSTVSELEERLKIVESACKEAMKKLDNRSRLMSEFSQLNDTVIQWSESGETVLAGASGKSGYEELAALHSNINDLLDQEESLDSSLSRMQEIAELLDDTGTDKTLDASTERLKRVADNLRKRLDQQTSTLEEWVELTEDMNKLQNWVEHTQKGLEKPEEHINVREQLQKKESLLAEIEVKKEEATGLLGRKKKVSAALGEKQPTVEEENIFNDQLSMLEHETKEQQTVLKESVQIQDAYDRDVDRLKTLIEDAQKQMSSNPVKHKNIDALKKQIAEHKALRAEIQKYEKEIYALNEKTRQLARMGGRRRKKSSELRPLFSKGRPRPGSGKHTSSFSPIFEGPNSPMSPLSSTSHLCRSREDVLFGSVASLSLSRSRENMSKSRENMSKSRENMSKSRESLSKSLRADSREDVSQSSLSEPASKNLSKMTFLNVASKFHKLATIEEPILSQNTQNTSATYLPRSKVSTTFGADLELELEIPQDTNVSFESSNSSNNMLLTYATTPPFMESSSSNSGKMSETSKSNLQKRSPFSSNSPSTKTLTQLDQNGDSTESTESFKLKLGSLTRQNSCCGESSKKSLRRPLEKNGSIESRSYVPTFATDWNSFTQSPTETNNSNLSIDM